MSSIILSFVGNQDPFSDSTEQEGSIVTLVRHLLNQKHTIKQVILLHTTNTQEQAELTQSWLGDVPLSLPLDTIALILVEPALSADPVNTVLAVQAARQGLEYAIALCSSQDSLELNASSGTPVMKVSWGLLQAAGYAPRSRIWQVRNPKEQREGQERVFQANVQFLRQEFDLKVIKQQLQDYNYAGARITLNMSGLKLPVVKTLLDYGHYRLSQDFKRSQSVFTNLESNDVDAIAQAVGPVLQKECQLLAKGDPKTILREVYFNAILELKNQKYADFLVKVSQFQEKILQYLVEEYLNYHPLFPRFSEDTKSFWEAIATHHPTLYQFLKNYRLDNGNSPLRLESFPSRLVMLAIIEYEYSNQPVMTLLQSLSTEYKKRNHYIHNFSGISELEGANLILKTMRQLLEYLGETDFANPFNLLNQAIEQFLKPEV